MGIGQYGTGIMTSTGRYPNVSFESVSALTGRYPNVSFESVSALSSCGTTWGNQLQTCIYQTEKDLVGAKGSFSTLASYLFNLLHATGSFKASYKHSALVNVFASQHHNKVHALGHIDTGTNWETLEELSALGMSVGQWNGKLYLGCASRLYESFDGLNFSNIYTPSSRIVKLWEFNSKFYMALDDGTVLRSTDAVTWAAVANLGSGVLGQTELDGVSYLSVEGKIWSQDTDDTFDKLYDFAAGYSVADLYTWGSYIYAGAAYTGNADAKIYRSDDGYTWTEVYDTTETGALWYFAVLGSYLYCFGSTSRYSGGTVWRTNDGTTWASAATIDASRTIVCAVAHSNYLYALAYNRSGNSHICRSSNGTSWTDIYTTSSGSFAKDCLFSFNARLYVFSRDGKVYRLAIFGDSLRQASAAQVGLMPAAFADRLANIDTNANTCDWKVSGTYVGAGDIATISVGFLPAYVKVKQRGSSPSMWEVLEGGSYALRHQVTGLTATNHFRPKASETIHLYTNGFRVHVTNGVNTLNATYYYEAIKET